MTKRCQYYQLNKISWNRLTCWIDEQTETHIMALVVTSLLVSLGSPVNTLLAVSVLPMKSEVLWVPSVDWHRNIAVNGAA